MTKTHKITMKMENTKYLIENINKNNDIFFYINDTKITQGYMPLL